MTLTDFLLGRLTESELRWAAIASDYDRPHTTDCDFPGDVPGICTCTLLDDLVADCEVKMRIVEGHSEWHVCPSFNGLGYTDYVGNEDESGGRPCPTLLLLARAFDTHPDFDSDWKI